MPRNLVTSSPRCLSTPIYRFNHNQSFPVAPSDPDFPLSDPRDEGYFQYPPGLIRPKDFRVASWNDFTPGMLGGVSATLSPPPPPPPGYCYAPAVLGNLKKIEFYLLVPGTGIPNHVNIVNDHHEHVLITVNDWAKELGMTRSATGQTEFSSTVTTKKGVLFVVSSSIANLGWIPFIKIPKPKPEDDQYIYDPVPIEWQIPAYIRVPWKNPCSSSSPYEIPNCSLPEGVIGGLIGGAVGGVTGTIVGGCVGGPLGCVVGGTVGGVVGGAVGGAIETGTWSGTGTGALVGGGVGLATGAIGAIVMVVTAPAAATAVAAPTTAVASTTSVTCGAAKAGAAVAAVPITNGGFGMLIAGFAAACV